MIIYTHESKLCEQILATDFNMYLNRCTLDIIDVVFGSFGLIAINVFSLFLIYVFTQMCKRDG